MPQKRRTKVVRHSRSKPKLTTDTDTYNLTARQKKEKLDLLLEDYDVEVQERTASMRDFTTSSIKHMQAAYMVELLKIPKHLRDMKVTDFLAAGGEINKIAMMDSQKIVELIANSVDSKVTQVSTTEGYEDKQVEDTATVKKKQGRGRKGTAKMKSTMMPPPTTATRTRRTRALATPACNQPASTRGWETPLVTPRFDPRLPITPAMMRKPKPGERVITMSIAGSPLTNGPKTMSHAECSVPLSGDKMLVVTSDMDEDNLPYLDSDVMEKIEQLQSKLSRLIDISKLQQNA